MVHWGVLHTLQIKIMELFEQRLILNPLETIGYLENWICLVISFKKYYTINFASGYLDNWIQEIYKHSNWKDSNPFGYLDDWI